MNLVNAEDQSRFMVNSAKYTLMLGVLFMAESCFPWLKSIIENKYVSMLLVGVYFVSLVIIFCKIIKNAVNAPMTNNFTDEHTAMLDRLGKSFAYTGILFVLAFQAFGGSLFSSGLEFSEIAKINLALCFMFYGGRVSWEVYKEEKLEKALNE